MSPIPDSSKDQMLLKHQTIDSETCQVSQNLYSFSKEILRRKKKYLILLRFLRQNNLVICFFYTTWQEISARDLLHKFLMTGQTLQIVRHRQDSVLKVGTVERKKTFCFKHNI